MTDQFCPICDTHLDPWISYVVAGCLMCVHCDRLWSEAELADHARTANSLANDRCESCGVIASGLEHEWPIGAPTMRLCESCAIHRGYCPMCGEKLGSNGAECDVCESVAGGMTVNFTVGFYGGSNFLGDVPFGDPLDGLDEEDANHEPA